jgi:hypothetical protein
MCGLYRAQGDKEHEFLGLASKSRSTVSPGLASKPVAMVLCCLASKPLARDFWFGPQNRQLRFGDLAHKINVTVSWFGPQNQVGGGLSVCVTKPTGG